MTLSVPAQLRVSKCSFNPSNQSVSGGMSMTGFEQVIAGPGGRWVASLTFDVLGEEEILLYRALQGSLMGRAAEVLVPPRDGIRPRDSTGAMFDWRDTVTFSGGRLFFGDQAFARPLANAAYSAYTAQGATAMQIQITNGPGLRPGHYFGIGNRLYRVLTSAPSTSVGLQAVTFWPPLRGVAAFNTPVILDRPVCRMRLAKDDSGLLDLAWRQPASPQMDFVEAFG